MEIKGGVKKIFFFYRMDPRDSIKMHHFIGRYWAKGNTSTCKWCGITSLSSRYIYIIEKLKKAGLLSQDYKILCCRCYAINKRRRDVALQ